MDDVQRHGSLPVSNHLRSATWREKQEFGTGAGYVFPHDYEGADILQQYLPDKLLGRRYYQPSEQGYEQMIGERMRSREDAREQARQSGGPRRRAGSGAKSDAMKVAGNVMKSREEAKRLIAARQRKETES